jgi:hypothetical protein
MRRFDLLHPFFADPVVPVAPVIKPVVVPVAAKMAEPKADIFSSMFGAKKVVPAKPVVEKTGKYQILTYSRRRAPAPFFRVHLVADALFVYAHIQRSSCYQASRTRRRTSGREEGRSEDRFLLILLRQFDCRTGGKERSVI